MMVDEDGKTDESEESKTPIERLDEISEMNRDRDIDIEAMRRESKQAWGDSYEISSSSRILNNLDSLDELDDEEFALVHDAVLNEVQRRRDAGDLDADHDGENLRK